MNRVCGLAPFLPALLFAADPREVMQQVQSRAQSESQRYQGTLQVISGKNRISEKRWTYERMGSAGKSKVLLRFSAPAEVRGVALLIVNHPDRASDQWMWTPSIQRDRRIAFQDRSTRFFGTDFSFEDLEERDIGQFDYRFLAEESIAGAPCWKLESRPRGPRQSQYTHSYLWVHKERYVIVGIEAYAGGNLVRRIRYGDYRQIQNIWTPLRVEVEDLARESRTILQTEKLEYNVPVKEESFTLQALRREL